MTLIRQPEVVLTKDVVAVFPIGTAFHIDLMVPVYAQSDGLMLENNSIIIDSKWNHKFRQQLPTDISIVAMLSNPSGVTDNSATPEILSTLLYESYKILQQAKSKALVVQCYTSIMC